MYAALLTSLLYLLIFHLSPDAPMRTGGNRPAALANAENLQVKTVAAIADAAEGKNVLLHFQLPADDWAAHAAFFATLYYRAAYEFYPRRVFVGHDDRVINFPADLKKADQLPDVAWLRQHQVPAVFSFVPGDEHGPDARVYRVP